MCWGIWADQTCIPSNRQNRRPQSFTITISAIAGTVVQFSRSFIQTLHLRSKVKSSHTSAPSHRAKTMNRMSSYTWTLFTIPLSNITDWSCKQVKKITFPVVQVAKGVNKVQMSCKSNVMKCIYNDNNIKSI